MSHLTSQVLDGVTTEWHTLRCHPLSRSRELSQVRVSVYRQDTHFILCYEITGNVQSIKAPASQLARRCDELWRHTCAELFIAAVQREDYAEFNFSPAGHWAAYGFSGYRRDMQQLKSESPEITQHGCDTRLQMSVNVSIPEIYRRVAIQLGLSMVIENNDGECSYWALRHDSTQPDFHHRENWCA
jgi:hypothetical protein